MNDSNNTPNQNSNPAVGLTVDQLRAVIREEIRAVMGHNDHRVADGTARPIGPSKPYLTVKEAAGMARLGPSTIRLYTRQGRLKSQKVGRRVIIKTADLERFLDPHPVGMYES